MQEDFYRAPGRPSDANADYIVHATALKGQVRAVGIRSTNLVRKAMQIHDTSPVATAALGRFLSGSLLLASNLKNENASQTSIIRCDGPIKGMTAVCDAKGHIRGFVNEPVVENFLHHPGKLNVGAAVGNGSLSIIRDSGSGEPYSGTVELVSGEIAEDFTYYLASSEQIPSITSLGVLLEKETVSQAGGFLIQLLPGATDETIEYLEKRAGGGFPDVTFLLSEGLEPEKILDMFLGDPDIVFLEAFPIAYQCNCSKERMEKNLITLGKKELQELSEEKEDITLECHFCNQKYQFSSKTLEEMANNL